MRILVIAAALSALLPAACASTGGMSDAESLALYNAHAGQPLNDIRYRTPIGWSKIDDQHLLLTMRPTEAYLIQVSGPCLEWSSATPTIQISTTVGQLSAKLDKISTPDSPVSCRIEQIRPVDVAAVRAAREQMASS